MSARIRKALGIQPGDYVLAAYAEPSNGPGYANQPLWVIIQDGNGKLRRAALQPCEQTDAMVTLYEFSALAHGRMTGAVRGEVGR